MTVYRGYFYKMLKARGALAPRGARKYLFGGKMIAGFELPAFPVGYRVSVVMTFIVNQEGVVFQKDFGPKTVSLGNKVTIFDPDDIWTKSQQN